MHKIAEDPLNSMLHFQYAYDASVRGRSFLAYAELKTAEFLGADQKYIAEHAIEFRRAIPDLKYMDHNQYFRFSALANELITRKKNSALSVLDVGGGEGRLAAFLPDDYTYCLVEPSENGISGTNLPFADRSFDYVVACHVLEHIPVDERRLFLDQLLSKAKQGVILLNPFHIEGTHCNDIHTLFVEITGAQWAKEHLSCTLPAVEEIRDYAAERGLNYNIKPNGTMATTAAFVFIDHFASKSGLYEDWKRVNAFFNQKWTHILDSTEHPNAYLIYIGWPEPRETADGKSI